MGRMLDTLNKSELPHRERPVLAVAPPPPIRVIADDEADDEPEAVALPTPPLLNVAEPEELEADEDESAPFIEVGGPRSQVDASPEVLAFPASRTPPAAPKAPDDEALDVGGTSEIWCSWTLRPGMKIAK